MTSVLVVDDEETLVRGLLRAFAALGVRAKGACDFDSAIRLASEEEFDAAVLDVRLVERRESGGIVTATTRSGIDLARELLVMRPAMRIVMLTGFGSKKVAFEAGQAGAIGYLEKPASADKILAKLAEPRLPAKLASLALTKREHLEHALRLCDGKLAQAARLLGLERRTLQRMMKKERPKR